MFLRRLGLGGLAALAVSSWWGHNGAALARGAGGVHAQEYQQKQLYQRPLHYNKDVLKLTDDSFEHQTQASTGQTTGKWLVWFYVTGDSTVISGEMPSQEFWDEHGAVVATLHGKLSAETAVKRFGIETFPAMIYFANRRMYRYQGPFDWDSIRDFVVRGHADMDGEKVPPPRSEFAKVMDMLWDTMVAHLIIASLVFIVVLFYIYTRIVDYEYAKLKAH